MKLKYKVNNFLIFFFGTINLLLAQQDSIKLQKKDKWHLNAHDTSSFYFNKGKMNFNFDAGASTIQQDLGDNGMRQGAFGMVSSLYNVTKLPTINCFGGYGIGQKSTIGLSATFQRVNFNPVTSTPNLTSGNITLLIFGARYTHCIDLMNWLYYGFQLGWSHWIPEINANTYNIPLSSDFGWFNLNLYLILGIKYGITKKLGVHAEFVAFAPMNSINAGLTYRIDARKKYQK